MLSVVDDLEDENVGELQSSEHHNPNHGGGPGGGGGGGKPKGPVIDLPTVAAHGGIKGVRTLC